MWNFPKGRAFLPEVSVSQLEKLCAQEKKAKPKTRLLAAILRKKGKSLDEIAYTLSTARNTVYGWLLRFIQRGLDAKNSRKQPGRPPELSVKQRKKLVKDLERGPPNNPSGLWTTKEAKDLLKRKYGAEFVNQHVWRLLTSLGFSLQRPRKRHYMRAGDGEIRRFKKKRSDKHATTVRTGLLWAHRMRQPSA